MTTLRRALGRWDLTAIGINQVIGAAIFLMPAQVAAEVGAWSPVGFIAMGLASLSIALNFAEAGSRFDGTGGPYLYTRAAFGRFLGFEVGWMAWFVRVASWASVVNVLVDGLGFYWPSIRTGALRVSVISFVVLTIMALNLRGIRQSSIVVNLLTIGKLTPLILFILLGLPHVSWAALGPQDSVGVTQIQAVALQLIFAFGGYEVIPVPGGEARDPKRA